MFWKASFLEHPCQHVCRYAVQASAQHPYSLQVADDECLMQTAEGEYEAILPDMELRAMYQRIVSREITVAGGSSPEAAPAEGTGTVGAGKARRAISSTMAQTVRLASVMGFPQLALPFRCEQGVTGLQNLAWLPRTHLLL